MNYSVLPLRLPVVFAWWQLHKFSGRVIAHAPLAHASLFLFRHIRQWLIGQLLAEHMCTVKQYMLRGQGRWKNWRLAGATCVSKARGRIAPGQGKKVW